MSKPFWILGAIISLVVTTLYHFSAGQPLDELPMRLMFNVPFTLLASLCAFKLIGIRP